MILLNNCMNKYLPYFYVIRHTQTGMRYAGCRYSSYGCHPSELLRRGGYYTSSRLVRNIIEREGISAFSVEMILDRDSIKERGYNDVRDYEQSFLMKNNCGQSKLWFNLCGSEFHKPSNKRLPYRFSSRQLILESSDGYMYCPLSDEHIENGETVLLHTKRGSDIFTIPKVPKRERIRIHRDGKNYTWSSRFVLPHNSEVGFHSSEKMINSRTENGKKSGGKFIGIPHSQKTKDKMRKNHWSKTNKIEHPLKGVGHQEISKERVAFTKTGHYFKVVSPKGETYFCCSLSHFGRKHGVRGDILSSYVGVMVPAIPYQNSRITQSRINTTGWSCFVVSGSFSQFLLDKESSSS